MTLSRWNSFGLWRNQYRGLADNKLFFAEDACGNQFCIHAGRIDFFDAETGGVEPVAKSFDEWAEKILAEYEPLTSYPLIHQWQIEKGPVPIGQRLMLKRPLVLGGNYALDNVFATEAIEGMRLRGHIATQIKDLPDGTQVDFRVTD
jgi:hypothetical protein